MDELVTDAENDSSTPPLITSTPAATICLTPITTQNAKEGQTLDLVKQYSRKIEFCNREVIRIHNRALFDQDQGSVDGGLIYVYFQAGVFEALKVNFIQYIYDNHGIVTVAQPKV